MPDKKKTVGSLQSAVPPSFGEDVRRVRTARRLTLKQLGKVCGYSAGHVSRVESGLLVPKPKFAEGCDRAFGTGDLFARQLKRLTEGEHPSWFAPYIDAERQASRIRDFSTLFIPGSLQTADYARASLSGGRMVEQEDLEARVRGRLLRREVLERVKPPNLWVVLCEAALWNEVGTAQVMAEQLHHILVMLRRHQSLTVQVLPFSAAEVGISAAFVVLNSPNEKPQLYVEGPQGGRPYEDPASVHNAVDLYDQLQAGSLNLADSAAYIETVRSEHERNARVDQVQLQRQARRKLRGVGPGSRVRRKRPGPGQQGR